MSASFFWSPFEAFISSYSDLVNAIEGVLKKATAENKQFAWRGQVNADWALHSSLYRRMRLTLGVNPEEPKFSSEEQSILASLHRWGLHNVQGRGRLSILNQLAMLQHFGAPTRLIDVSFNAWVGVFFAVEQKWSNAELVNEREDGRLFAIDVTDKLINEKADRRDWEDALSRPWTDSTRIHRNKWTTSFLAWKPPSLDARIAAQNGGFLLGGVPGATGPNKTRFQFPKSAHPAEGWWPIDKGRGACSLALRPHKFSANVGAIPNSACYTFRIEASAKEEIRKRLELMFGYKHSTIYPDYTGFSDFAVSHLKRW